MLVVHGTRAFRNQVPGPAAVPADASTTALGPWYATLLSWRPRVALLVNQATLIPLLAPLAPARTLLERLPDAVTELLAAHRLAAPFIHTERAAMANVRLAPTANRSVVGVLNEFARLADLHQTNLHPAGVRAGCGDGLLELSLQLARTPLSPLYTRHVSPDRELAALVSRRSQGETMG